MEIPNPNKAVHPGAKEAPASSPATYPDEAGFQKRARLVYENLAKEDLSKWRQGWFKGGDPGKYLIVACVAKQLVNEKDPEAIKYMSDDRTPKEKYHFAIVNWARYLPLFGHTLPPATFQQMARVDGGALGNVGTENHVLMWRTSAVTLSTFQNAARPQGKDWLQNYVRNLYRYGQGEWDSSSYLPFDINGMLNIYDFSKDEECRLLAKAALDWFAAAYALKYVNGMHTGPKERGDSQSAATTGVDHHGWLWWDSSATVTPERAGGFRHTLHAITSSWRPNRVLCNLAQRRLPKLPFETRNSKPNYWVGLDGPPKPPVANVSQESLYVAPEFTLGSMWFGEDLCTQLLRLQLGVRTPDGAVAFTGAHVGEYDDGQKSAPRYGSGQGTKIQRTIPKENPRTLAIYNQFCQVGPAAICLAHLPEKETYQFTFLICPEAPTRQGAWFGWKIAGTLVAAHPLTKGTEEADSPVRKDGKMLKFPGRKTGFILQAASVKEAGDLAHLTARCAVDLSKWESDLQVTYKTFHGRNVVMKYGEGQKHAQVSVDGQAVSYDGWPVYDGPYVSQKDGVLSVNDGQDGFVVDFRGELPQYGPWRP